MERLKESHGVTVSWRSYELRPHGTVITEEYKQKILSYRPKFQQTAKEQYGVDINYGPFGIDSRPALTGAKYADAHGVGEAFHDAIMHAYWQDARDISDLAVLAELAVAAGLEEEAFLAALDATEWKTAVDWDIQQAVSNGLQGVPALVFNQKYLISGAQPYEQLTRVVDQVSAETSAAE